MASPSLPSTMKVVHQPDPNSTRLVLEDAPLPTISRPDECLVRVYTTTPCAGELHWETWFPSLFAPGRERVPCTEAAGVVAKLADSDEARASGFKIGDEVFFRLEPSQTGNLRQYTLARLSQMAHKSKNVGWTDAGATPLSALTAWQGVFQHGVLDEKAVFGDEAAREKNRTLKVLITGASGVVGSWAVQFASLAGAGQVITVAGGHAGEYVRKLGATDVLDYKKQSISDWVAVNSSEREVDAAFDCVGGSTLASCWSAVKEGGVLHSITGDPQQSKPESITKKLAEAKWFLVEPNGKQLGAISKLQGEGKCVTKVDSLVDLADFQEAFDKVEDKKANGKVVIRVQGW
ncbi:zinc-binding dehydrogenase [Metarhizium robertsii]|uniref:Alcohol dehydrogenase superfamily, zinc-type n=2 Tax=Metarhizium robertsii TaxID=568076 RepID=E9F385_METRA|nr:Alcohol dehydrogenase superfamily, zinc-type [Metarhizium robertsii ARSEF 23]EFY97951.1 Alcohol dehydrogenase superfamily, zinc-type [Metarhizium robertsii ARSEF 23]EXU97516.1 zinc-binding dehydrogenase [Metarhizium robertsii]